MIVKSQQSRIELVTRPAFSQIKCYNQQVCLEDHPSYLNNILIGLIMLKPNLHFLMTGYATLEQFCRAENHCSGRLLQPKNIRVSTSSQPMLHFNSQHHPGRGQPHPGLVINSFLFLFPLLSLPFLPATPSSPSRTLEGLFELTRRPSRALDSPRALLPERKRKRGKDTGGKSFFWGAFGPPRSKTCFQVSYAPL